METKTTKVEYVAFTWRGEREVRVAKSEDRREVVAKAREEATLPTGNPFMSGGSIVWERVYFSDGTWHDYLYRSFDEDGSDDTVETREAFAEAADDKMGW